MNPKLESLAVVVAIVCLIAVLYGLAYAGIAAGDALGWWEL